MNDEQAVRQVYPDAHYQPISYTLWAEPEPKGVTLVGFGKTEPEAWDDARYKLTVQKMDA